MIAPAPPKRILIIKPSSLGDVVTALPVLRGLRRAFPDAHIGWLLSTACAPLLAEDTELDDVVLFDRKKLGRAWRSWSAAKALAAFLKMLRRGKYDWVIDLQGLFRSAFFARVAGGALRAGFSDARECAWLFYTFRHSPTVRHTIERNVELTGHLGIDVRAEDMTLQVAPAGLASAEEFRSRIGGAQRDFVALVPPTRWQSKCYPARRWPVVAASLARRMPVALLGAASDRQLCESIADAAGEGVYNLAGQTTIPEMVGLIAAARCVVCGDSAAQFIAQAVATDVVVLIGPTRPERTGPLIRGRALVADVPCQGCLRRRCHHTTCMQTIAPEAVVSAVEGLLGGGG